MRNSVTLALVFLLIHCGFGQAQNFNADINRDRFVDTADLSVLSQQWLSFQPPDTTGSGLMLFALDTVHTWLVAKSGNDANSGHPSGYPLNLATDAKLTVQAAIDAASPGDTIIIWPGTYVENVTVSKTLQLIGFGSDATLFQSSTTHALQLSNSGNASGTRVRGIGAISTASGIYYGINLGYNNHNCVFEYCYGEGDYDGIHLRSNNRCLLWRCHGKGKFDGIQAWDGEGHRIIECLAETDGSNTIDAEVNGFVCTDATGLVIVDLTCKARRALDGDGKHLTGCLIKGDAIIDGLTIDVEHTGTGAHDAKGLSVDTHTGSALVRNVKIKVKNSYGTTYGFFNGSDSESTVLGGQVVLDVPVGLVDLGDPNATVVTDVNSAVEFEIEHPVYAAIATDLFNGYWVLWTAGANAGEARQIQTYTQVNTDPGRGRYTFAASFSNAIQSGDVFALYSSLPTDNFDLFNDGGTLGIALVNHDQENTSGEIDYLAPVGVTNGAVSIGAFKGDETVKLSDFWARKY